MQGIFLNKFIKETNYPPIKGIRNIFRLEKETEAIKDRIIRDIRNLMGKKIVI